MNENAKRKYNDKIIKHTKLLFLLSTFRGSIKWYSPVGLYYSNNNNKKNNIHFFLIAFYKILKYVLNFWIGN